MSTIKMKEDKELSNERAGLFLGFPALQAGEEGQGQCIPAESEGARTNSKAFVCCPIDFEAIRRSQFTRGVRESGTGHYIFVVCDPDNPNYVIAFSGTESGAENENTQSIVDSNGYVGYIINHEFIRNKKVTLN